MRQELWDTLAPLREQREQLPVKWIRPDNLHLSLKFLGEVAATREDELRSALQRAARSGGEPRALPVQIEGFGVFPDYHRPRVLWAGVTPDPALELLQHGVEQAFAPLGFPTEARPFRPHVTLARASRNAAPRAFAGLEALLEGLQFSASLAVADLDLMQSTLEPSGPVYLVKHRERLS